MKRRLFIKGTFALSSLFIPGRVFANKRNNSVLNGPLAGSLYYTSEVPGRWKNRASAHIPSIEKSRNKIEVQTGHEMRGFEHYIVKHSVFDENFNLISEKLFDPSKDIPISNHDITGVRNMVFALSVCNKHDSWLNDLVF